MEQNLASTFSTNCHSICNLNRKKNALSTGSTISIFLFDDGVHCCHFSICTKLKLFKKKCYLHTYYQVTKWEIIILTFGYPCLIRKKFICLPRSFKHFFTHHSYLLVNLFFYFGYFCKYYPKYNWILIYCLKTCIIYSYTGYLIHLSIRNKTRNMNIHGLLYYIVTSKQILLS